MLNAQRDEVKYVAGKDEYLVRNKGMRFGAQNKSFITKFINNRYVEYDFTRREEVNNYSETLI